MNVLLLQKKLLAWYDQFGRKDLPWQQSKNPYHVWLSEVMLQQTKVGTVIPYFKRFIRRFKTLKDLASSSEDEVLHYWTGLGYYNRARNLHKAAMLIMQHHGGQLPDTMDELINLPGIGLSTAGAICASAFNKRETILDGNVKRVLARLHGIKGWSGEKEIAETLWQIAKMYTPKKRVACYTQAIMDFGALLCTRSPLCYQCPLQKNCIAYKKNLIAVIPTPKPKKNLPLKKTFLLFFQFDEFVFLQKKFTKGVWRCLWAPPALTSKPSKLILKNFARQLLNVAIKKITFDKSFRHTFSHYHLDITPIHIEVQLPSKIKLDEESQIWYNVNKAAKIGLPTPIKKILGSLSSCQSSSIA